MSGQATGWVLRHGPRDRAQRSVLLVIADAANWDGEHARPGLDAIIEGSLYSAGHVRRTIAVLISDGWLEQTESPGPGKAAEFRLLGINGAHHARRSEGNGARPDEIRSEGNGARTARERRANGARPDEIRSEEDTAFKVKSFNVQRATTRAQAPARDADFEAFYLAYPRRGDPADARKAYAQAVKRAAPELILAGAERYRADPNRDQEYTKLPATWLRHGCWDDDPLPLRHNGNRHRGQITSDAELAALFASLEEVPA